MFTGLIEDLGELAELESNELGARLTIRSALAAQLSEGDSVAVNGVCLTATEIDAESFSADAMNETLSRSSLGAAPELLRYVAEKGSIAVDGVSLTVSRVDDQGFDVWLIPETTQRTNLGGAALGRTVNLEVDILAKYVERLLTTS